MTLYLTAAPDRLAQARAATAQLAHAAYRIGPGSQLLAAPLPAALRGGLMVVSDRQAPAVEQPEPLARQLVRVCLRRGFSGIVLDLEELPEGRWAEDRAALIRQLAPLLTAYGRRLYVPEIYAAASPETVVLLCTALSGGSLHRLRRSAAGAGFGAADDGLPPALPQRRGGAAESGGAVHTDAGTVRVLRRGSVRPVLHLSPGRTDTLRSL